jgi:hypothetical protein
MISTPQPLDKGAEAEELLRDYFLSLGYFTVRGLKFTYQGNDVTDVDLWLYHRHSPISRERVNVDIKNKKTPQAIERIFWARGVQLTLGLDRCVVVTTDKRKAVVDFGVQHNVLVLDGNLLATLKSRKSMPRLSEADLLAGLNFEDLGKLAGDWIGKYNAAKSALLSHLDFDGCNRWLEYFEFFVRQSLIIQKGNDVAVRLASIMASYFLVGLDFSLAQLTFATKEEKKTYIEEGLRYGKEGKGRMDMLIGVASRLAASYVPRSTDIAVEMRRKAVESSRSIPAALLGEFFSRTDVGSQLFQMALAFQEIAYSPAMIWPDDQPADPKSVTAVLLDFVGVERKKFFSIRKG